MKRDIYRLSSWNPEKELVELFHIYSQ